jgi:hypothetical protein
MNLDQRVFCDECGFVGTPTEAVTHNLKLGHLVGITENYGHRVLGVSTYSAFGVTGISSDGVKEMQRTHLYWCPWADCPGPILDDKNALEHERRHGPE